MAAGSQSVESWAKKLDLVQLGKKSIFPWKSHAVQLARVSRKVIKTFRNFSIIFSIHMFFFTFLFRNLPNPKLLVHGPKALYVSKRTQSCYSLPKARASYRRRDNVMSYVLRGGWEGSILAWRT